MNAPPTDPALIRAARELDRALRPLNDAALAHLGLTRDDLPGLIAAHQARQRDALVGNDRQDAA